MTRINTNVSSLVAQNTLGRSNADLNQALTRLSTGLRINTGKDDPAGLIASENLRSDITSIRRAISNTDRANQVIATADSALGQVSSLLNDIRGLITESANTGALSDEQIAANQLQLDSSLDALNRIAQTTTFQGRRLLDGSLDFLTTAGTNFSNLSDLQIDQANLGATGSVAVNIDVSTAATQATVSISSVPVEVPGVTASDGELDFQTTAVTIDQASGTLAIGAAGAGGFDLAADASGAADGAAGNSVTVSVVDGGNGAATAAAYDSGTNVITVTADIGAGSVDITAIAAQINTDLGSDFTTSSVTTGTTLAIAETGVGTLTGGVDAVSEVDASITITATAAGASFNRTITFVSTADEGAGGVSVTDDGTTLAISVDDDTTVTLAAIEAAIDAEIGTTDFSTTLVTTTGTSFNTTTDTDPSLTNVGAATAGTDTTGGLASELVIELGGNDGSEVLSFGAGTTIAELQTGIDLVSDATGVTATVDGTTLNLTSVAYGSSAYVDLTAITDDASLVTDARNEGVDIVATINGVTATGNGNELSINTATLDINATLDADFTGTSSFTITGGGALFQLGPDVVSNQQARLGIGSVNTARLGGVSGKLFQLQSGGSSDLTSTNLDVSAKIVEEAIDQVTSLRGRLGAFQRTTLETNKQALNDTLINLSEAESSIRDADFASESAALTRSQILVQSGTTVLQIANQNPQNVLALLR